MEQKINFDKSSIESENGNALIIGVVNGKHFRYHVSFAMGFMKDELGNLTTEEMISISNEFQESEMFDDFVKNMNS
jgi:hypothetical protein